MAVEGPRASEGVEERRKVGMGGRAAHSAKDGQRRERRRL